MQINKTILEVTILHEGDWPEGLDLNQIATEMYDGDFLGRTRHQSTTPVDPKDLLNEEMALGNDGTFFSMYMEANDE